MSELAQAIQDAYQAYCDAFTRLATNEEVAKLWERYQELRQQAEEYMQATYRIKETPLTSPRQTATKRGYRN